MNPAEPSDQRPSSGGVAARCTADVSIARRLLERALAPPRLTGGAGETWQPPEVADVAALFPGFEVLELIGRGGMGAVYKAHQESLDRLVAIKLLPLELSVEEDFAMRFRREAQAMAKLGHPNIVAVYDYGETGEGHFYIVMEYIDGPDLGKVLATGELELTGALSIVRQVCDALEHAHGEGLVHRDVKPSNVLMDASQLVAKVSDFGVARLCDDTEPEVMQTVAGGMVGTPAYIAPEQIRDGRSADHRADIYSLGVMLYELLTGELPRGTFPPASERAGVGRHVDHVVERAMQSDPVRRYQSAAELREDLRPKRGRATAWLASAAVLMLGLGVWGAMSFGRSNQEEPPPVLQPPQLGQAFTNSLGMQMVPIDQMMVLFNIHETRVSEFRAFQTETGRDMSGPVFAFNGNGFVLVEGPDWQRPPFNDGRSGGALAEEPVTCVSWDDAQSFCAWLTEKERGAGLLPTSWRYRLPTGTEWEQMLASSGYPLRFEDGLSETIGNLAGEEMRAGRPANFAVVGGGWRDAFAGPAPVGSFAPSDHGLYDVIGNVNEWLDDGDHSGWRSAVSSNWVEGHVEMLAGSIRFYSREARGIVGGFRVVLTPLAVERQ